MKHIVLTDEHSPERFRVNRPLSNSDEFTDDFKCALKTNMNLLEKCEVW